MAKSDNKLLKLAKEKTTTMKKNVFSKNTPSNKSVVKKSTHRERELKAKKKVEELLQDIPLSIEKKDDDLLIIDDDKKMGIEWLEEQISQLLAENEKIKEDYSKLYEEFQKYKNSENNNDNLIKSKVIELFNEIQTNHINLGVDPNTGIGNFRIYCPGFLNRLITFFPFLIDFKKY
ncbi:MAG TPA: hypothetical protein PLN85_00235 [archaeon]|nr:hypothetical protein [archaeon]